jgi:hypothetical protein
LRTTQKGGEIRHSREDARTAGGDQAIGMVGRAMTTSAKSDDRHGGRDGGRDTDRAVFNHDAVLARRIELLGREEEEIGSRLPPLDLRGAEHVRIEER